jgi:hypothetical protein
MKNLLKQIGIVSIIALFACGCETTTVYRNPPCRRNNQVIVVPAPRVRHGYSTRKRHRAPSNYQRYDAARRNMQRNPYR